MDSLMLLLWTGGTLLYLGLLFVPLERAFPARPEQKVFRPDWWLDLCFFLGQYLLWGGAILALLRIGRTGVVPLQTQHMLEASPYERMRIEHHPVASNSVGAAHIDALQQT